MLLILVGFVLVFIHFSVPLVYYALLKVQYNRPWSLVIDKSYTPTVAIILPTYNESQWVKKRLDNLAAQDYPKDRLKIIVVDSASTDGTGSIVQGWITSNPNVDARLLHEPFRRGKFMALARAVHLVPPAAVIVVFSDADAYWEREALREVASFFADPQVGGVTGSIFYVDEAGQIQDDTYRAYYNFVRVAESRFRSTAVVNGPLLAIRRSLLLKIGLPDFPGSDDSAFGSLVALTGHRMIQIDSAVVMEYVRGDTFQRRVRRANCLVLNFRNTKRYARRMNVYVPSAFDDVWRIEWWLTLINPWSLLASVICLTAAAPLERSLTAAVMLIIGALALSIKSYRTWVLQQVYLMFGAIRGLRNKDVIWNR